MKPDIRRLKGTYENVWFKYKKEAKEYVLSDVSFKIEPGQTVGIIGQTGSAKTTLVQLIPRLYDATQGTVKIDGIDVRKYPMKHLRDAVSVVLQKNTLFSGTVLSNLKWGEIMGGKILKLRSEELLELGEARGGGFAISLLAK